MPVAAVNGYGLDTVTIVVESVDHFAAHPLEDAQAWPVVTCKLHYHFVIDALVYSR